MILKDRFFSILEIYIEGIKFVGIKYASIFMYHYLRSRFFPQTIGNIYKFLNFKITYLNKSYLRDIFFEHFCLNAYFFYSKNEYPVILDIGANIGDTVIYFKWLYPKSTIFAFEPHPQAYKLLNKNIELNKFKNVYTYNEALGNRVGIHSLKSDSLNVFSGSSIKSTQLARTSKFMNKLFKVKSNKLSLNKEINDIKEIDMLKIDIEGAESELFQDLNVILSKTIKVIIEYHFVKRISDNSLDFIISKLQSMGFKPSVKSFYRDSRNTTSTKVFLILAER